MHKSLLKLLFFIIILILNLFSLTKPNITEGQAPTPTCSPNLLPCSLLDDGWCCTSSYVCNGYCQPSGISPSPQPPVPTLRPTNTPTPTPAYSICTGYDGIDPCRNYSCSGTPNPCQQHGGQCIAGYCYPVNCRCGHSQYDCPSGMWTCQTTYPPYTCSLSDTPIACRDSYINCTGGAGNVPCTNDSTCVRECGDDIAYCNTLSRCYVPISCGALKEGAGSCVPPTECPVERQRHQLDCLPGQICCAPPPPQPQCFDQFTGVPGTCYFLTCPPGYTWGGTNPINGYHYCSFAFSCCYNSITPTTIPRSPLNAGCTINGELGIDTAIGCIPLQTQTNFLSFVLRWALGVGGGTAFILIIVAGFLIITSSGDPQRLRAGKELLTSAIIGLLMIIFSVYLLDVIGLRILRIPGL